MSDSPDPEPLEFESDPKPPDFARRVRVIRELMAQGFSEPRAAELAVLIGDHPERDEHGHVIVRNRAGSVIDRVKLKEFGS